MNEHDIVRLKEDFQEVKAGTTGTIVSCYVTAAIYVVEFPKKGKSNVVYSLHKGMLEAI